MVIYLVVVSQVVGSAIRTEKQVFMRMMARFMPVSETRRGLVRVAAICGPWKYWSQLCETG
jgi:hypothetical protein